MATSDKMEYYLQNKGFRQGVQAIKDNLARHETNAQNMEKEYEEKKMSHRKALASQGELKYKIEKIKEKIIDVQMTEVRNLINGQRKKNGRLRKEYNVLKEKREILDQNLDSKENDRVLATNKAKELQMNLEYGAIDTERKNKGYQKVADDLSTKENACLELEKKLTLVDHRNKELVEQITNYEKRILETETELEEMRSKNLDNQQKYREMLIEMRENMAMFFD